MAVEVFARTPQQLNSVAQRIEVATSVVVLKVWGDRLLLLSILATGEFIWKQRFEREMRRHVGIPPTAADGLTELAHGLFVGFAARYKGVPEAEAAWHLLEIGKGAGREMELEVEAGELNAALKRKKRQSILDGWQSLSTGWGAHTGRL